MLNYSDLTGIDNAFSAIEHVANCECGNPDKKKLDAACAEIRTELNKIFYDRKCMGVIYTENIDKEFFGIIVKPHGDYTDSLVSEEECNECYFKNYVVEFDSKLFASPIDFYTIELVALLLHDVDTITSVQSFKELRDVVNCISVGLEINPETVITKNTKPLFSYCVCETAHKMFGICEVPDYGINMATELIRALGLEEVFVNAFEKVQKLRSDVEKNNACPVLALNWFFYTMKDFSPYNRLHLYTLRHAIDTTGSCLFRNMIHVAMEALDAPSLNVYVSESAKKKGLVASMKANGMKSLEDDVFEYSMRIKNIDDENSAILLMRQINSRMGIIADYLETEELSEFDRSRWEKLYNRYDKLRDEMVKKPIYSRKMYGLFVDYNALMNMNAANQMTMNTMY